MKENRRNLREKLIKNNDFLLFLLIAAATFASLLFNVKSLELFGLSYKTLPFILSAFATLLYLFQLKSIKISKAAVTIFLLLLYAFFVTISGYYIPDGIFLLFFLFCTFILPIGLENMHLKRRLIFDAVLLIAYFDALFSSFEYAIKTAGWKKIVIIPHSIYITSVNSIGGLFYQPNLNSLLLNIGLFIVAFKIMQYRGRKTKLIQLFLLFGFFAINCSLSSSRAGLLAASTGFVMILLLSHFKKIDLKTCERHRLFIMIFLYYFLALTLNNSPIAKFSHQGFAADASIDERLIIWTASIMLWLSHPIFGTGLETFKFLNNPYQIKAAHFLHLPSNEIGNFIWAHSELLQIAVELGAIGLISVLILILKYYIGMIRSEKRIHRWMAASIFMLFLVQSSLSWPMRHPVFIGLFFIILAATRKRTLIELKGKIKTVFTMGVSILYIAGAATVLPSLIKDFRYHTSESKNTDKRIEKLWLLSKDPYLFWMASGAFLPAASVHYMKITSGIKRLPEQKADIKKTKMTKAEKTEAKILKRELLYESKKAEKLHKVWITEYYLGLAYLFNGNLKEAKKYAKKGISMNPNASNLWVLLHFINVKNASLATGKPVKEFLPSKSDIKQLRSSTKNMLNKLKSLQQR